MNIFHPLLKEHWPPHSSASWNVPSAVSACPSEFNSSHSPLEKYLFTLLISKCVLAGMKSIYKISKHSTQQINGAAIKLILEDPLIVYTCEKFVHCPSTYLSVSFGPLLSPTQLNSTLALQICEQECVCALHTLSVALCTHSLTRKVFYMTQDEDETVVREILILSPVTPVIRVSFVHLTCSLCALSLSLSLSLLLIKARVSTSWCVAIIFFFICLIRWNVSIITPKTGPRDEPRSHWWSKFTREIGENLPLLPLPC